jgi:VWFA-related protein
MRCTALLLLLAAAFPAAAQYGESITVERILIDVRVTDASGEPLTALTADDFHVAIGGRDAEVVSAEWIDDVTGELPEIGSEPASTGNEGVTPSGRLVVLFVQTDFARESFRIRGQLGFMSYAEQIIESLEPRDRVAVFSFDSHLKFRLDFTADKDAVLAALRQTPRIDAPPPPPIVPNPALASRLDREAMRNCTSSEMGLLLIGNALRNIPGPKTLLLMGWGLGVRTGKRVSMRPEWKIARNALDAARVSIFALDTAVSDYHDLELGMRSAAKQTGGFYAKTHDFPQIAVDRFRKTITGRYELELRRPAGLVPGTHALSIRVSPKGAVILAPSTWMDR